MNSSHLIFLITKFFFDFECSINSLIYNCINLSKFVLAYSFILEYSGFIFIIRLIKCWSKISSSFSSLILFNNNITSLNIVYTLLKSFSSIFNSSFNNSLSSFNLSVSSPVFLLFISNSDNLFIIISNFDSFARFVLKYSSLNI